MFTYKNINDYVCKSLKNKVLIKVNNTIFNEKIKNAYYDSNVNSIVVDLDKSGCIIYDNSFIIVDALIEIDWENYAKGVMPKFGFVSPYIIQSYPNEDYGTLFTTDEFYDCVEDGTFIDADGTGYPSNGSEHVYMGVGVKELAACKYSKTVTHIMWYNQ